MNRFDESIENLMYNKKMYNEFWMGSWKRIWLAPKIIIDCNNFEVPPKFA